MIKDSDNLDLLDLVSLLSFYIGLVNLDYNITQSDLDSQTQELDRKLKEVVDDIHKHLKEQDIKLNKIMEVLYDKDKGISRPN